MNTPPFLLGAALLFWGWQTGMLFIAVPAAALLEASRWIRWRLELDQDHYDRLWNLSALLLIGLALYQFFAQGGYAAVTDIVERGGAGMRAESIKSVGNLVLRTVQLTPATLLIFMAAYAYGPVQKLPLTTFSLLYRRLMEKAGASTGITPLPQTLNPSYAYVILVLLAAGASRAHATWYFPIMVALIAWTLWPRRSPNFAPWLWVTALLVAVGVAFSAQAGLLLVQKAVERWQNRLMSQYGQGTIDTSQTRTSMGRSDELKQSGRIVWRVRPGQNPPPALLQEAVFNRYENQSTARGKEDDSPSWTTRQRKFEPILDSAWNRQATERSPERSPERSYAWILNSNAAPSRTIVVTGYTRNGEANVPLPSGPILVTDQTASVLTVQTNALGAARILGGQNLAILELRYGSTGGFAIPPIGDDRTLEDLAPADARAIEQVARELKLKGTAPAAALAIIRLYFFNHFEYSLRPTAVPPDSTNNTPLSAFLLDQRKGHCEYFATATTLLLRAAGIPARYAVGYSLQEKRSNNEFVARSRHAHAWSLAWINGRWLEVDNTPAGWFEAEWAKAGPLESWSDWASDAWLGFQRWRQGDSELRLYIFAAGVLALGFLAWRQVTGKSWRRARASSTSGNFAPRPGADSEFYRIEEQLQAFRPRGTAEPLGHWLAKLERLPPALQPQLRDLLHLHYRHRFDPAGLPPGERDRLRTGTSQWLADFKACLAPRSEKSKARA